MIRAVLFDYSGVFTSFGFTSLDPDLLRVFWGDYGDVAENHPWHQLERGEIAFPDFLAGLGERARDTFGDGFDLSVYFDALRDGFAVHYPMVHLARELKGRYRLALLTNNVREFGEAWRTTIPVADLFDEIVDSCEVGCRKPEPAYFRRALEQVGIPASEAVFIDDMASNVEGARAMGIRAILATDPEQAVRDLRKLL